MKTLVIVHVYYPQLWPELAACLGNITGSRDVVVTYVNEASVVQVRRDLPEATFLKCENVGYDIWPFLKALAAVDLSQYGIVVKLHTKRDIPTSYCANNAYFGGSIWRERLLGFVRTSAAWRRTLNRLSVPDIGMVADRRLVYVGNVTAPDSDAGVFDRALDEVKRVTGIALSGGRYVAGSMFAAKVKVLRPLAGLYAASRFEVPEMYNYRTLAHVLERAFGLLVSAAGLQIDGFNGSVRRREDFYSEKGVLNKIARFFFWRRYVDGEVKIKICRVQVRHRKITI